MNFGIMFWGDALPANNVTQDYYKGLIQLAQSADQYGFAGIWLPERHFHGWGGQHPNPSVLAAALAVCTTQIRLRAGSVVLPLHNPLRVAEEWAVVDNLSGGRAEISIASGWKDDDFTLAPRNYRNRTADMWEMIESVRRLWRGELYSGVNGSGVTISISTHPRPIQKEIPLWITSAGSEETIKKAGSSGFGLLTHLLGQDIETLAKKLNVFRQSRSAAGFEGPGQVAVMVHTYVGRDNTEVKETVRGALMSYLQNSADLVIPHAMRAEWEHTDAHLKSQLMEIAFERHFNSSSLMGTPARCYRMVERLRLIGVTEICCLIDFGLPIDSVLEGMKNLVELSELCAIPSGQT